jgi:3-isopropylmalate dehydrogenase
VRRSSMFHDELEARRPSRRRRLACLAGDGVGPELTAEAKRALARLSALHSFAVEELHLPFAGEAVTRYGHALPSSTRTAYRTADAILVATPQEPALEAVKADLDLVWRVTRVHLPPAGDALVFGGVAFADPARAVARAFSSAASKRGRLTAVGASRTWREAVDVEHARWPGMTVEHLTTGETLVRLRDSQATPEVIVTEAELVAPLADAVAHLAGSPATVAHAWLAQDGPGLFFPGESAPADEAGFGVADPTAMLLTLVLLLAEGLQLRSAARTLERAVTAARPVPRGTRSFTDAVLALLPEARTDVEHFAEVWA